MKTQHYLLATLRETPADADVISQQLMLKAGMIRKLSSGIYTWLPLGLRVLNKVAHIIREEMNRVGAQEILMPAIQPAELWHETGRWGVYGNELLKIRDRHEREFCFGPTHEEVVTALARNELKSYKQLPVTLYQIQTKFRDEIRPRFGVMRGREFLMKDAYSFHVDTASLAKTYDQMYEAYTQIFTCLGLVFRAVQADSGQIGGDRSHEFHVLANSGEDEILFCPESDFAANRELACVATAKEGDPSPDGKGLLKIARGIEVGHIFQLGTKYSQAMGASVTDEKGESVVMQMGCYGIGVSRIVAAAIEQNHDEKGIIWPDGMAPFQVAITPINADKSPEVEKAAEEKGIEVLLDNRAVRPGVKFADMDLIGIPHRFVISDRLLANNQIEYKHRKETDSVLINFDEIEDKIGLTCSKGRHPRASKDPAL